MFKLRKLLLVGMMLLQAHGVTFASSLCPAEQVVLQMPADPAMCARLDPVVRQPSRLPLDQYEAKLSEFLRGFCHRREDAGWRPDKTIRDTGPFVSTLQDGRWTGVYMGTHAPVVVWYSPDMLDWIRANRSHDAARQPSTLPDGAMMIKEMYPAPGSACRDIAVEKLRPTSGAAIMVRDATASYDGWFWGWVGWDASPPDWPAHAGNALPDMGFGQYCTNCHASARDHSTFSSLGNIKGEPGTYLNFLSQDFWMRSTLGAIRAGTATKLDHHAEIALDVAPPAPRSPAANIDLINAYLASLQLPKVAAPDPASVVPLPSATYDNVWVPAGGPTPHSQFLTSDQCVGCHSAGGTGLQFDMTAPGPDGKLLNLSPYATWRSSPMGLAGRDPVFYAQLASEVETFHPASSSMVQDTCLGCHGVQGQRQFGIDQAAASGGACPPFTRDMTSVIPFPGNTVPATAANYGALARDGVSCTTCHQIALGPKVREVATAPQNRCVTARQDLLNPHSTGFARTFTGSFMIGKPGELGGPFPEPKQAPMRQALGIVPAHDTAVASSEVCGSCHTVHLPVVRNGETLGYTYEQATYAEWAFSAYRTGSTPDGALPAGAGPLAQSCQGCHMPSRAADGTPTRSKIAGIQEVTNFPQAENTLPASELDLPVREEYAQHLLVGLNLFLVKMAEQFPDLLGTATADPMLARRGAAPGLVTEQAIVDQALNKSVDVAVTELTRSADGLSATVVLRNKTGHRFPSGVSFRRAFINFEVLDADGRVIWASGRTNAAGMLLDENNTPLRGEQWWTEDCKSRIEPEARVHQPHRTTVTRQDQVQIYEELTAAPPATGPAQCGRGAAPSGPLTTSFLSICSHVKDNRLMPEGYLPRAERVAIAQALGAGEDLADDTAPLGVDADPGFRPDGSSAVTYKIATADLPAPAQSVRATLYYQATPPYYLQDRMCTATGADTKRLATIIGSLDLSKTQAADWKLRMMSTGVVKIDR